MSHEIIIFDLVSKGRCACWSLNPWKTRMALNFKGIPYKTEFVEYPDLKPTLQALGVAPHAADAGMMPYTSPTVRLPDGSYQMDSRKIVDKIEALQPEPSLHLDNGYLDRAQNTVLGIWGALTPVAMPRIPEMILPPRSAKYFNETREPRFGMKLTDLAKSDRAGETAWKNAEKPLTELKEILHEHPDGPYVMGQTPSYADFIITGFFKTAEKVDQDGDLFGRLMKFDEAFPKHYEACRKWTERDDH